MASHEYHFNSSKNNNLHTLITQKYMQRCSYYCTVQYSVTKCSVHGHYNYKQRQSGLSGNPSLTISRPCVVSASATTTNKANIQWLYTLKTPQQRLARAIVCT